MLILTMLSSFIGRVLLINQVSCLGRGRVMVLNTTVSCLCYDSRLV